MSPREHVLVSPISPTEIAIFGGYSNESLGDVFIFDTVQKTVKEQFTNNFKFHGWCNQSTKVGPHEQVIALVEDGYLNGRLYIVSYRKGDMQFRVIETIGPYKNESVDSSNGSGGILSVGTNEGISTLPFR